MSVQQKPGGGLRLACDGDDWCTKKFSPQTPIMAARDLRWRAADNGWSTEPAPTQQPSIPGVDVGGPVRDICPGCRRARS